VEYEVGWHYRDEHLGDNDGKIHIETDFMDSPKKLSKMPSIFLSDAESQGARKVRGDCRKR
jgi:hypothetical protein